MDDFATQNFVRRIDGESVEFDYRGVNGTLADAVTVGDLRWMCGLLSRLSDKQWRDAVRAGGYSAAESTRYIGLIRGRIVHAQHLIDLNAKHVH